MGDTLHDDSARLRALQSASDLADSRAPRSGSSGAACQVGKILTASSASAGRFYKVQAHSVTGAEAEGGLGTLNDLGYYFYALNLGTAVPPATTPVLCEFADYRWVFRYDG